MAGITGLGTTYNLPNYVGELFAASPEDTPLLSAIGGLTGGESVGSTIFEWQGYDLRDADFPVVIWIAGDDSIAANEMVNRLNEWMDTRFINTHVFADESSEESQRPTLWRLWMALPPKGQIAIFAGGLMRAASMRADSPWRWWAVETVISSAETRLRSRPS